MRGIREFIFERFDQKHLENVKVSYDILPEIIYIEAPLNYSESDLQIYINDVASNNMPSSPENAKRLFGKNSGYIDDAYFEYDKFEHLNDSNTDNIKINIKWDKQYDEKKTEKDLSIFKITNMKYVILFSDFDIYCETDDQIHETIDKIFKATDNDKVNDFEYSIKYNSEATEFDIAEK